MVSSTYSMIKNVAAGQCVTNDGSTVADTTACNASSDQGWEVQNRSGSEFQLGGSGVCLFDEQDSYVGTIGCSGYGSSTGGFWRLGAGNSLGGLLVNTTTGKCLAWVNSYGYNLTTETCNEGNTGQLWYDGGRA